MGGFEAKAKALEAAKEQYIESGKSAIKGAIKQFMDEHPEVGLLQWQAYIPGFNDGDPCRFTLSGPRLILAANLADSKRLREELGDCDYFEEHGLEGYQIERQVPTLVKDFAGLDKLFDASQEALEAAFGYDVQVVVDRDGN